MIDSVTVMILYYMKLYIFFIYLQTTTNKKHLYGIDYTTNN